MLTDEHKRVILGHILNPNGPNVNQCVREVQKKFKALEISIPSEPTIRRFVRRYMEECFDEYTTEYIEDQDLVGEFLTRCCDRGEGLETQAKPLYMAFKKFCAEEKGLSEKYIRTLKTFMGDIRQKGLQTIRNTYVFVQGVAVKESWQGVNRGDDE